MLLDERHTEEWRNEQFRCFFFLSENQVFLNGCNCLNYFDAIRCLLYRYIIGKRISEKTKTIRVSATACDGLFFWWEVFAKHYYIAYLLAFRDKNAAK